MEILGIIQDFGSEAGCSTGPLFMEKPNQKLKLMLIPTKTEMRTGTHTHIHIHTFSSIGTQCVLVMETVIPALDIFQRQHTFSGSKHFFPEHNTHFIHSHEEATAVVWVTQHAYPAPVSTTQCCSILWPKALQLCYLQQWFLSVFKFNYLFTLPVSV